MFADERRKQRSQRGWWIFHPKKKNVRRNVTETVTSEGRRIRGRLYRFVETGDGKNNETTVNGNSFNRLNVILGRPFAVNRPVVIDDGNNGYDKYASRNCRSVFPFCFYFVPSPPLSFFSRGDKNIPSTTDLSNATASRDHRVRIFADSSYYYTLSLVYSSQISLGRSTRRPSTPFLADAPKSDTLLIAVTARRIRKRAGESSAGRRNLGPRPSNAVLADGRGTRDRSVTNRKRF